jgi:hypothetical protein
MTSASIAGLVDRSLANRSCTPDFMDTTAIDTELGDAHVVVLYESSLHSTGNDAKSNESEISGEPPAKMARRIPVIHGAGGHTKKGAVCFKPRARLFTCMCMSL